MTTTEYYKAKDVYIKELVSNNSRKNLDVIAAASGLDPRNYPSKREIALAIMMTGNHGQVHTPYVEITVSEEEKKEMSVQLSSVKSMRNAINDEAASFMKFYKGEFMTNIIAFHDATQMFREDIKKQVKENSDFDHEFGKDVKKFQESIEAFRRCILEQSAENNNYIKQFYG